MPVEEGSQFVLSEILRTVELACVEVEGAFDTVFIEYLYCAAVRISAVVKAHRERLALSAGEVSESYSLVHIISPYLFVYVRSFLPIEVFRR